MPKLARFAAFAIWVAVHGAALAQAPECSIREGCPVFDDNIGRNHYGLAMKCSYTFRGEQKTGVHIFSCSVSATNRICELTTIAQNSTVRDDLARKPDTSRYLSKKAEFEEGTNVVAVVRVPVFLDVFVNHFDGKMNPDSFKKMLLMVKPGLADLNDFRCENLL